MGNLNLIEAIENIEISLANNYESVMSIRVDGSIEDIDSNLRLTHVGSIREFANKKLKARLSAGQDLQHITVKGLIYPDCENSHTVIGDEVYLITNYVGETYFFKDEVRALFREIEAVYDCTLDLLEIELDYTWCNQFHESFRISSPIGLFWNE